MPVDDFNPNPFGLYNILGNVWEWTEDCIIVLDISELVIDSDGKIYIPENSNYEEWCLARGGAFDNNEEWQIHASYRLRLAKEHQVPTVGFRVAREVNQNDPQKIPECDDCPQMIVLPGKNSFNVKVPLRETEPCENEQEQQEIFIKSFAIAKHEITVKEWNTCFRNDGCQKKAFETWFNKDQPITNVSWKDAQEYVKWLSKSTDGQYRLPSGAEWEYAARGNTDMCRWWGDELGRGNANCVACRLTWKQFFRLIASWVAP